MEVIENLRARARLIVDLERRFQMWIRVLADVRYLFIAEPVDEKLIPMPKPWDGVSGKIKQEREVLEKQMEEQLMVTKVVLFICQTLVLKRKEMEL